MLYLIIAFILSAAFVPWTITLAKRYGLVTDASARTHPAHTHKGVIPRAGGAPIFVAILLTTLIALPLSKIVVFILIAGSLLVVVGLIDDKYDMSPYVRFILNFVVAGIAIAGGIGIPYISNPFGPPILLTHPQFTIQFFGPHVIWIIADMIAIFWLVAMMNIINWSKGIDGQLPGFVGIACIFLALIAKKYGPYDIDAGHTKIFAQIVAGAFLGFWPWNFFPQKIMPGYGGGALAGFLLGVLTILAFGKMGTLFLVLAIPILDGFYTMLRRFESGKNPFRGDSNHLHHLLLRRGWGKRTIVGFYVLITTICGIVSLMLPNTLEKFIAICVVYFLLFAWIYRLASQDKATHKVKTSV
ncbi:undecaprenyl/decaprenyl-phosphate alpha-N-acetylglucosaminyl 1-phosphate transferase [Candidatus Woesebacteria bacterium]|nr:undecaprenyl/decaprenyl-phosphate alpha-N-acetylglucosaminyl 1-phosphate transferase [Candidatus Woesebacteria bacterium]